MSEINQLARAKLALKQSPPLIIQFWMDEEWQECITTTADHVFPHRVHPDDEEKLDAIIWDGADNDEVYARINTNGEIFHFRNPVSVSGDLIATRELPAEKPNELADKMQDAFYEAFQACEEKGISVDDIMGGMAGFKEHDQLFSDLKEFVTEIYECFNDDEDNDPHVFGIQAKALLDRINPKPVRNSADLPVDTLCEVWNAGQESMAKPYFTTGNGGFHNGGMASETNINEAEFGADNFKVLEQPKPTFWQGGECPVPDWVEVKLFFKHGNSVLYPQDYSMEAMKDEQWSHKGNPSDVIAYQIMGEKDGS